MPFALPAIITRPIRFAPPKHLAPFSPLSLFASFYFFPRRPLLPRSLSPSIITTTPPFLFFIPPASAVRSPFLSSFPLLRVRGFAPAIASNRQKTESCPSTHSLQKTTEQTNQFSPLTKKGFWKDSTFGRFIVFFFNHCTQYTFDLRFCTCIRAVSQTIPNSPTPSGSNIEASKSVDNRIKSQNLPTC